MKGIWGMGSIGVMGGGKGVCAVSWSAGERWYWGNRGQRGKRWYWGHRGQRRKRREGRGGPDKIIKLIIN